MQGRPALPATDLIDSYKGLRSSPSTNSQTIRAG